MLQLYCITGKRIFRSLFHSLLNDGIITPRERRKIKRNKIKENVMSLYSAWQDRIEALDGNEEYEAFWKEYFEHEKENYKKILGAKNPVLKGKLSEVAASFNMKPETFLGFLDGANTSLTEELDLENLTEDSELNCTFDFEKLLFNMHSAKADWLYELEEWVDIFDEEKRLDIRKLHAKSKTVINTEEKIGRNDPCPCGSGKKYKKCCINK
jgi:uncharacterized protein YecA (UPF0149 family)